MTACALAILSPLPARTPTDRHLRLVPAEPASALDSGALHQRFAGDVLRLCRRMLADADEAQEARNETFLRAQQGAATWDGRPLRAWLLGIAAHHCVDRLRRRSVEGRLFVAEDLTAEETAGSTPSPLSALLARERQSELEAALAQLPDRYRAPLVLRFLADLSTAEIAERLELTPAQVALLLFRAKQRLRDALARGSPR
jgi:RNA polymerase sigma-70 factor (ECF subfamily)